MRNILIINILTFLLSACTERITTVERVNSLPKIFPDYIGVTVPVNIAPLNFALEDNCEKIDVEIVAKNGRLHTQGDYAQFDIDQWHKLLEDNLGDSLVVTVRGKLDGRWREYGAFPIYVSNCKLDDYGLTYRKIAPGYEVFSSMGIYERDLSNFDEKALIENTRVAGMCINCHSPMRGNANDFILHVRGENGGMLRCNDGQLTVYQAFIDTLGGMFVYPSWHPEGRYCAFSTNQTRQGFHTSKNERIEVFDNYSDVLIFDTQKGKIVLDTTTMTKAYSENTPHFSADGKYLYFTTALQREYPLEFRREQYNLCRIAFDAEKGAFTGSVDTIFNAVKINKSTTWPRESADGRYLMFTLADYGYFSIWHKESDLYLLDTQTLEVHPLDNANSDDADSYHTWSNTSNWYVFTSRRADGLYTQLFIALIDDNGNSTKPFLLPQDDPKTYYSSTLQSFNTPEFISVPTEKFEVRGGVKRITSDQREKVKY